MAHRLFSTVIRAGSSCQEKVNSTLCWVKPHSYMKTSLSRSLKHKGFMKEEVVNKNIVKAFKKLQRQRSVVSVAFLDENGVNRVKVDELTDDTISSKYNRLKGDRDKRLNNGKYSGVHKVDTLYLPSESHISDLFEIENNQIVGTGTYGTVIKAVSKATREAVAIKAMKKEEQPHYQREIDMLKRVNYKGCVRLFQVLETSDKVFLVMELLSGGDLFDFIVDNNVYLGNLSTEEALVLTKSMLCSLEACHLENFAHLDVKPENFVFRKNAVKDFTDLVLVDFGAAQPFKLRPFAREKNQYIGGMDDYWIGLPESHIGGTASYVSPEVIIDGRFSSRSDIWSMGVTLYMMLTGQRPFEVDRSNYHSPYNADKEIQHKIKAEAERARHKSIFKTCKDLTSVHPGTKRLLEELTQPDPANRPSTTEAIHYIETLLNHM